MATATPRTQLTRKPDRGSHEAELAEQILAESLVGHLGFLDETGQPLVLPVAIAPDAGRILIHGSTGSRLFRTVAAGAPICLTVTVLDALVLARSAFESSMNYRSLVVLGTATELAGPEKEHALRALTEHLTPGRWETLRPMTRKEVAATSVLALPLAEFSVKARSGGTDEPDEDASWPTWAGQLPVVTSVGVAVPEVDLPAAVPAPLAPHALGGPRS
jgi:nitroimidazol reductase NimA-like FMN-containing flavoprotein (pyridoxamine 5'-phosphate oxidase superfamily)